MRPMTAEARGLEALIEFRISGAAQTRIDWEPESLLVINNRRMIHARGKSAQLELEPSVEADINRERLIMQSWHSGGLWIKAKLFMDHASEHDHSSTEFAFFAALALECLGRSALTKVHPVLNADPREDANLLYACGYSFAKPRSLPAHAAVYIRLEKIIDPFQKQHRELCEFLALQRNAHVHTADLPYENLGTEKWLAQFYDTVAVLHEFLGKPLESFLGKQGAAMAAELVKTLNEGVLSAVKAKIAAHHKVFEAKPADEKKRLLEAASSMLSLPGHNQYACICPACGGRGTLTGTRFKELPEQYSEGELYMEVEYLTTSFQCKACELSLGSIEEIAHAGLPTHFKKHQSTSLHDLYEPEHYQEYDNM